MKLVREGSAVTIITYGCLLPVALDAAQRLEERGVSAAVLKINELTFTDGELLLRTVGDTGRALVLEDCVEDGCLGQRLAALLLENGVNARLKLCNLGSRFVQQGTVEQLYTVCKIDAESVAEAAKELCHV